MIFSRLSRRDREARSRIDRPTGRLISQGPRVRCRAYIGARWGSNRYQPRPEPVFAVRLTKPKPVPTNFAALPGEASRADGSMPVRRAKGDMRA